MDALETLEELWRKSGAKAIIVKDRLGVPHTILGKSPTGWFIGRKSGSSGTSEYDPNARIWYLAGSW